MSIKITKKQGTVTAVAKRTGKLEKQVGGLEQAIADLQTKPDHDPKATQAEIKFLKDELNRVLDRIDEIKRSSSDTASFSSSDREERETVQTEEVAKPLDSLPRNARGEVMTDLDLPPYEQRMYQRNRAAFPTDAELWQSKAAGEAIIAECEAEITQQEKDVSRLERKLAKAEERFQKAEVYLASVRDEREKNKRHLSEVVKRRNKAKGTIARIEDQLADGRERLAQRDAVEKGYANFLAGERSSSNPYQKSEPIAEAPSLQEMQRQRAEEVSEMVAAMEEAAREMAKARGSVNDG